MEDFFVYDLIYPDMCVSKGPLKVVFYKL